MTGASAARTEGTEPELINPDVRADHAQFGLVRQKLIWVRLDALYVRDPDQPRHVNGAGVRMDGEVPGTMQNWLPTYDGGWIALGCQFQVFYADGRGSISFRDCPLPAYAVRARYEDGARPDGSRPDRSAAP